MQHRKGAFEMIPDFLKEKEVKADMFSVNEMDILQEALAKQQKENESQGKSMKELFEEKRIAAEKKLEEAKKGEDNDERKARLLAQRDLLRKAKEQKRQEELADFNKKTETKSELFAELKKMDEQTKEKQSELENERRKEMYRKIR